MARRVAWTNNSSGHSGTNVYRAPTLDPQNLPAPVATVDPVAQGETAEWIDNESLSPGDYDYAVQDYDAGGEGALSAIKTYTVPEDYSAAQVGDYIGGGVYAGIHAIGGADYHIVAAAQTGESSGGWGNDNTATGSTSLDDGLANQQNILANYTANEPPAIFYYARDYGGGGHSDWYVPALNELRLVYDNLVAVSHPEFVSSLSAYRWTSTEKDSNEAWSKRFTDGHETTAYYKYYTSPKVRPIRRVAV